MTRIIAIGDIHLHAGPRNDQRRAILASIIGECIGRGNVGAWFFLGDVFHARSTVDDRNFFAEQLQRCASVAPIGIVKGNHDGEGELEIFARLAGGWPITVFTLPGVMRMRLADGSALSTFAVPYPQRAGLVLQGQANADLIDAAADALDLIFLDGAAKLDTAHGNGDHVLMIGHANISGAIASNGQPQVGVEISLMPRHLDRLGNVPKLFGHIHKPQEIHGAVYAGSIARNDWGEREEKRFLELHLETGELMSRPIDCAPLIHVEGELTRNGFTWQVLDGPAGAVQDPPASWADVEVRVRYRFAQSESAVLDRALVSKPFAGATITLNPIAVPDRALRAPEVAAAKTLPEKVAAWCAIAGTVASEGALLKLGRIEQFSPEVVLDAVKDHVSEIVFENEEVPA